MVFTATLLQTLDFTEPNLLDSTARLRVANLLCVVGALVALWSAAAHWASVGLPAGPGAGAARPRPWQRLPGVALVAVLALATAVTAAAVGARWVEVNHFPSQTMSEVLVMFGFALLVAMLVLHFALPWRQHGPGWAVVGDKIVLLVFLGVLLTNHYASTLTTAQRDLPPALQSYWFAPHLVALIFSYATLGIAGLVCVVYFSIRFWSVLRSRARSARSQLVVLAALTLVPFAQVVTVPVLLVVGLVMLLSGTWLERTRLDDLERKLETIAHRAFAVGFPFLTAGLFMGAFWAQEAWANYWGWDSKENSALITWLVYVVYIHLRMLGGYRGERSMAVLMGGALSVFLTFQVFGYLPDSQKSLHRYTDDGVVPTEGMQGAGPGTDAQASAEGVR